MLDYFKLLIKTEKACAQRLEYSDQDYLFALYIAHLKIYYVSIYVKHLNNQMLHHFISFILCNYDD